jgi:hypothetical protein
MPSVRDLAAQFEAKAASAAAGDVRLSDADWWAAVGNIVTDTGRVQHARVRDAFKGPVEVVRLPPGTVLYKYNDYSSLQSAADGAQNKPISPWWSPYHPFRHDPGWDAKQRLAKHLGVSIREWGRVTSAVKENWNSLNWLCVITLRVGARAAFGGFAQMARRDMLRRSKVGAGEGQGLTANLPGGATQFYIPGLEARNVIARFESLAGR